jgi:hypothetical protein
LEELSLLIIVWILEIKGYGDIGFDGGNIGGGSVSGTCKCGVSSTLPIVSARRSSSSRGVDQGLLGACWARFRAFPYRRPTLWLREARVGEDRDV